MERTFHTRSDWFEAKIKPAIWRRTIFAVIIFSGCIVAWFVYKSWVPLVLAIIVFADRVFELAHIPSTKRIIGSTSVVVSEKGLSFFGAGIKGCVLYPWNSLSFETNKQKAGQSESVTIRDNARKKSKVELVGYEAMGELVALIERNAGRS